MQTTDLEKIFVKFIFAKIFVPEYIKNSYKSIIKTNNSVRNEQTRTNTSTKRRELDGQ